MDDDLRQAAIEHILNPKPKETVKEAISSTSTSAEDKVEDISESKKPPNAKYDLTNSLGKVLEARNEQSGQPNSKDADRAKCNERLDKKLLRSMMGNFRL